jgi:hypothetical protein
MLFDSSNVSKTEVWSLCWSTEFGRYRDLRDDFNTFICVKSLLRGEAPSVSPRILISSLSTFVIEVVGDVGDPS